jgi:hypothetical protein
MRALAGLGLVTATGTGDYQGTPLARHLLRDSGRLHGHALMSGQEYYEAWSELDSVLRTGKSAYELRHGRDLWARLSDDEDLATSFNRTMRWNMERTLAEILDLYSFPERGIIADLGAGDGALSATLLRRYPGLRAIVFEQPSAVCHSSRAMRAQGLADRCEFIGGSFLDAVPQGADLYLLKSVIHNWDDATAVRILSNCRDAMSPDNRLILIERARFDGDPLEVAVRDLAMLVLFGSHDRTSKEYGELMRQAGLRVICTAMGPSGICVLEAGAA